ncbi:MAG TPA: GNAT family protein [Chitinophagaceae bacterium]|nr:GNAT family protein [Chitinophagaceae bacterium]
MNTLPDLHTPRCLLRPVETGDQPFIYAGLSHPEVTRYFAVRYDSLEATGAQMEWYQKNLRENRGGAWKVIAGDTGAAMGVVAYYDHRPEHRKAEIGFWFLPEYWRKGVAREAITALIDYCEHVKDIHRLEAFVEAGNEASHRLLLRLGFVLEGTMRECEIRDGEFLDLGIYALLLS